MHFTRGIFHSFFKIPIIYGLLIFFTDIPFNFYWLFLIPAVPLMVLLSLALGFIFSFTSYLNRDVAQISYLIPLLILVFTPIIFVPQHGFVSIIQGINPFSHWLYLFKGLLLHSTIHLKDTILLVLGSLSFYILSWKFVCYTLPYVAEEART